MAALGAIGTSNQTTHGAQPGLGVLMGAPWWHNPYNRAIGTKNETNRGPQPGPTAFMNGRVPASQVPVIVGNFGQAGGGVTIF